MAISPLPQRLQHGTQTLSFFREVVLNSGRMVTVESPGDQAVLFHGFQTGGQCIGSDAGQRLLKILKFPWSLQKQVTQQ